MFLGIFQSFWPFDWGITGSKQNFKGLKCRKNVQFSVLFRWKLSLGVQIHTAIWNVPCLACNEMEVNGGNSMAQHYMVFIWTICRMRAIKYPHMYLVEFSIWHKVLMDDIIYLSVGWSNNTCITFVWFSLKLFSQCLLVSASCICRSVDQWGNLCSFSFIHFFIDGARRNRCNIGIVRIPFSCLFVYIFICANLFIRISVYYCLSSFFRRVIFLISPFFFHFCSFNEAYRCSHQKYSRRRGGGNN